MKLKLLSHQPSVIWALESLNFIKSFTYLLYFDITSISGKPVERTQKCYFRYYRCPEQLTFKKMKWFWKLILLSILSPNMRRFVQDFFSSSIGTSDRYVQQIYRAMTTYNFCNFNILGIFQFKLTYCSASYFIPKHMFK